MYARLKHGLLVISITAFCQTTQAAWDEGVDGELSADAAAPTAISIVSGSNIIIGANSIQGSLGRDIFEITLASGQQLDSIILDAYTGPAGGGSFFAVQAGSGISTGSAAAQLGQALIGTASGNSVGDNVLDDLGLAGFGGSGFTGSLTAGTYTFWFQETAGLTEYQFDLQVSEVPLPAAAWLFGSALLGLMGVARRKKV